MGLEVGLLNIRLIPHPALGAGYFLLQPANAQEKIALLERPAAVGTHKGHALGRQAERDCLRLAGLQFHLRERNLSCLKSSHD